MEGKQISTYAIPGLSSQKLTIPAIARILLQELNIDIDIIRTRTRKRAIISKRQTMIYLMHWYGFGWTELAVFFRLDHATMWHSFHRVQNDMLTDKRLKEFIVLMQETRLKKD